MIVRDDDAWNFCYAIPNRDPATPRDDTRIVVPNSLQIGPTPPFFCAASETARDVIQQLLNVELPPHPLENFMLPNASDQLPKEALVLAHTMDLIEVFVDDFIRCTLVLAHTMDLIEVFVDDFIRCTDNITHSHLVTFTRAMLHGMYSIFQPPSVTGHKVGDPISEKKLKQLDGLWQHVKEILGWILKKGISNPSHPKKIVGTLHHASMGIPGG